MQGIQILVLCEHPEILATIVRLLNQTDQWQASGTRSVQEALGFFRQQAFDLVLLGSGFSHEQEVTLVSGLRRLKADVVIVEHFGGGSGLLGAEIRAALDAHPGMGSGIL